MKDSTKDKKIPLVLVWTVVILAASGTAFGFSRALSDSLQWQKQMEASVINPSFFENKPSTCKPIPDFILVDRNGKQVKLSDFAPFETLLVNLWSTGCPVCEQELPSLTEMDRRIGNTSKIALLTITTDEKWEDVAHLFPRGTSMRILFDPEQKVVKELFHTTKFPETFVLDKKRCIRARFDGEREWQAPELISFITSIK